MAKTREEREAEEASRREEEAAFGRRGGLRRSIPTQSYQSNEPSGSELPSIPENDSDDEYIDQPTTRTIDQQTSKLSTTQQVEYKTKKVEMSDTSGSGKTLLPESVKLKGEENYEKWQRCIMNIAISNDLEDILDPQTKIPAPVNEHNEKVSKEKLEQWKSWKKANSTMMNIIELNTKGIPAQAINGCRTAIDMWTTLQTRYEGSGAVLQYNLLMDWVDIKLEDYSSLEEFIIAYTKSIDKLDKIQGMSVPEKWQPLKFIMGLSDAYPLWAERQRSNSRNSATSLSLKALIQDISDEARKRDGTAEGSGAHYNGKPDKKSKKDKDKSKSKDKLKGKCKNCKNPNAFHKSEDCFVVNKKLRQQWEEKTGKKFVPYDPDKSKKDNKTAGKADKSQDEDQDDDRAYAKGSYHCVHANRSPLDQQGTLFDTGAEHHIVDSIENLDPGTFQPANLPPVDTAGGLQKPLGYGRRTLICATDDEDRTFTLELNKVQVLPKCGINIFGARDLLGGGRIGIIDRNLVVDIKERPLFRFNKKMMIIEAHRTYAFPAVTPAPKETSIRLWHRRFGHLGLENVRKTSKMVKGMILKEEECSDQEDEELKLCDPCEKGKAMRHVRKKAEPRHLKVFDEVHIDVVMITPLGIGKKKYATVFTEKASSVRWVYFHIAKNGAYDAVVKYQKMVQTQYQRTIKKWRIDGGKEYSPTKLVQLAEELGQKVELTTPYNPEQDGTSERSIGIICERTRTAMIDMDIPMFLWPVIFETMVLIINRTATSLHKGKTPFEVFTDKFHPDQDNKPSVAHFRVLGCKTYVQIPKERRVTSQKVKERAEVGILVGYEGKHIFQVYIPTRKGPPASRIVRSSNVRFDEGGLITKPFPEEANIPVPSGTRGEIADQEGENDQQDPRNNQNSGNEVGSSPESDPEIDVEEEPDVPEGDSDDGIEDLPDMPQEEEEVQPQPRPRGRPKGSKNKVHIPNPQFHRETRQSTNQQGSAAFSVAYFAGQESSIYDDPLTIHEAKQTPEWPEWKKAIDKEYRTLDHKKTWQLEKRSDLPGIKVLPGKLVLKTKRDRNGNILKHKARWVVKGFRQEYSKDFDQTYAGVCKNVTWKLAIAIAALFDLEIEQMDVVSAFLNSNADSDTYVEVPPDWEVNGEVLKDASSWTCKLLKALYGLKQAPRLWQKELASVLQGVGYQPCTSDQCVYVNKKTGLMIVTYVDDMLIIGKDRGKIKELKRSLFKSFEMEDLGQAKYFLGVRITRNREKGIIALCQDAYINKILIRYGMEDCKPADTPMAAGATEVMIPFEGKATDEDIELYGSKIGSLMYLAVQTRPDISYGVSVLSRFLNNPSPKHIRAADRILHYLQGTKMLGIEYRAGKEDQTDMTRLHGYCDADFAGDKSMRKSVSGNVYFFAGGVISHSSKRQPTVAQSTTEAEYYSLAKAISEALWLRQIMDQMMYSRADIKSIKLYGDNQGSLSLAENPEFHQRTKHIDVKHHFIREHIANKAIDLWYIASNEMVADGLTKPLTAVGHAKFVEQLRMRTTDTVQAH